MLRELDFFLNYKTTEIGYKDEKKIRHAFFVINFLDGNKQIASLEIYKNTLVKELEKIKWMKFQEPDNPLPFLASNK